MHNRINSIALSLFVILGCGASSGFQQAAPREPTSGAPLQVNDSAVASAFALRPQLPKPYRLGVVFRDPPEPIESAKWRWEPEQRAELIKGIEALEASDEIDAVFSIARSTLVGDDLQAIRVAAARHNADAVLVVSGQDEAKSDFNAWAATYVALVPVLFAPAAELEVRFVAHAELWDVRNEYLYLAAEGEARADQQRPLPMLDREEAGARAQHDALELLRKELAKRLTRLNAAPPNQGA